MADTIIFLMEFALIPGLNEDVICSAITFTAVDDATFPPAAPPIPSQTTAMRHRSAAHRWYMNPDCSHEPCPHRFLRLFSQQITSFSQSIFIGYLFSSELTARGVNITSERSANRNIDTVFLQYFGKAPEPFSIASYVIVFPYVVYGN